MQRWRSKKRKHFNNVFFFFVNEFWKIRSLKKISIVNGRNQLLNYALLASLCFAIKYTDDFRYI